MSAWKRNSSPPMRFSKRSFEHPARAVGKPQHFVRARKAHACDPALASYRRNNHGRSHCSGKSGEPHPSAHPEAFGRGAARFSDHPPAPPGSLISVSCSGDFGQMRRSTPPPSRFCGATRSAGTRQDGLDPRNWWGFLLGGERRFPHAAALFQRLNGKT